MIDLGEAETIDCQIAAFRQSVSGESEGDSQRAAEPMSAETPEASVRSDQASLRAALVATTRHLRPAATAAKSLDRISLGTALRQALFDPLLPALGSHTRLFLSPDGDLTRLPFEVLPLDGERRLIDAYRISYLGVGRDVLRFGAARRRQPTPPLVAADPDFDLRGRNVPQFSPGIPFRRLAGTRQEGKKVASLLKVTPLLRGRVLEKALKAHPSPRILHIATHGFFLHHSKGSPNQGATGFGLVGQGDMRRLGRWSAAENPLLRSGLALAGANTWLQEQEQALPEEAEDGILSAEDVSGLDLLDTELVVLSACETGLGAVQIGEGVLGLRRAFALAGAKTLVMSLWKVPDQQTQELMENFYRRLQSGQDRSDALREAQLAMKERYPQPLYWGAFICQGEPGPLAWLQT
jgi:CHAT domain-containing protein